VKDTQRPAGAWESSSRTANIRVCARHHDDGGRGDAALRRPQVRWRTGTAFRTATRRRIPASCRQYHEGRFASLPQTRIRGVPLPATRKSPQPATSASERPADALALLGATRTPSGSDLLPHAGDTCSLPLQEQFVWATCDVTARGNEKSQPRRFGLDHHRRRPRFARRSRCMRGITRSCRTGRSRTRSFAPTCGDSRCGPVTRTQSSQSRIDQVVVRCGSASKGGGHNRERRVAIAPKVVLRAATEGQARGPRRLRRC